jgi:ppGpp synthetase/RelA/SpoT-type nucleotidyltranferase
LQVGGTIRSNLVLEPTGRPGKSTGAIVGKLDRQKTRLSQMQDIAGCRILVPEILAQDRAVDDLLHLFQKAQVFDRRDRPSYGYRAVHVVVTLRSSAETTRAENGKFHRDLHDVLLSLGQAARQLAEMAKKNE